MATALASHTLRRPQVLRSVAAEVSVRGADTSAPFTRLAALSASGPRSGAESAAAPARSSSVSRGKRRQLSTSSTANFSPAAMLASAAAATAQAAAPAAAGAIIDSTDHEEVFEDCSDAGPSESALELLKAARLVSPRISAQMAEEIDSVLHIIEDSESQHHNGTTLSRLRPLPKSSPVWKVREALLASHPIIAGQGSSKDIVFDAHNSSNRALQAFDTALFLFVNQLARKAMKTNFGTSQQLMRTKPHLLAMKLFTRLTARHASLHSNDQQPPALKEPHQPQLEQPSSQPPSDLLLPEELLAAGMEAIARDPKIPITRVLTHFRIDQLGRDAHFSTASSTPWTASQSIDASQSLRAYGLAMRALAYRGEFDASDALFRALVRRSSNPATTPSNLQLNAYILSLRWSSEVLRIQSFARTLHLQQRRAKQQAKTASAPSASEMLELKRDTVFIASEAKRALGEILGQIGVQDSDFELLAQPLRWIPSPCSSEDIVRPDVQLMTNIVASLSKDLGAHWAATATWHALERRWPSIARRDAGFLEVLMHPARTLHTAAARKVEDLRPPPLWRSDDPAVLARRRFRQWLFERHPQLDPAVSDDAPLAPAWLPAGDVDCSDPRWLIRRWRRAYFKEQRRAGTLSRVHQAPIGRSPGATLGHEAFHTYANLLRAMLATQRRRKNVFKLPSVSPQNLQLLFDLQCSTSELVLLLAWMRRRGVHPPPPTLLLVGAHLRGYYKQYDKPWPPGRRSLGITSLSKQQQLLDEGMGPLNDWLREWVEQPLPTLRDLTQYKYYRLRAGTAPARIWDL